MAREMEAPRHVQNRRQRTREGPELACVQTPLYVVWHTQGGKGKLDVPETNCCFAQFNGI